MIIPLSQYKIWRNDEPVLIDVTGHFDGDELQYFDTFPQLELENSEIEEIEASLYCEKKDAFDEDKWEREREDK
jgi:hypothetical protein